MGAGVCGLTCAHDLALLGYSVEVFESAPVPGGMLYLGIPHFRLPREIIKMEVDNILALGVTLHTRVTLGRDISFAELRSKFDAVLLATGLNKGRELNIPGAHLAGVYNGIDFLINVNLGYEIELGKRVVVVGGGNVAIDVARAAVRLVQESWISAPPNPDAESLQPALDAARMAMRSGAEAGVHGQPGIARSRCRPGKAKSTRPSTKASRWTTAGGRRRSSARTASSPGSRCAAASRSSTRTAASIPPSATKRRSFPATAWSWPSASRRTSPSSAATTDVQVTPRGILKIDENLMTTAPGVFAGGDVAFGPRILVEAVANGHRAARSIHVYLSGKTQKTVLQPLSHSSTTGRCRAAF